MSGSSIDWTLEFARARTRAALIDSQPGLRGVVGRLWAATEPWVVVVVTGVVVGTIASCLDILSAWLSDLRLGACKDMWWMSRGLCCAGLDRTFVPFSSLCAEQATQREDFLGVHTRDNAAVSERTLIRKVFGAANETCRAWQTWGELVASEKHIVVRAIAQYGVYITLAVSPTVSLVEVPQLIEAGICRCCSL